LRGIALSVHRLLGEFGNFLQDLLCLVGGVYFWEVVDEFSITEKEGLAPWFIVGMSDFEGVANPTFGIGEEGKGETKLV